MNVATRWIAVAVGAAVVVYTVAYGVASLPAGERAIGEAFGLLLFAVAMALTGIVRGVLPDALLVFDAAVGLAMPLLSTRNVDPAGDYSSGAWWIAGSACLASLLLLRGAPRTAAAVLGLLVLHTLLWAGPWGLLRFAVLAVVLLIGVVAGGARAVRLANEEMHRFVQSEQRSLEWEAAQLAHHAERQVRLTQVGRVGAPMLHRIVAQGGRLDAADRFECRLLEQTIRDEVRGRRLLNEAVRAEVAAARRRGAIVQVLDDGGVDDVPAEAMEPVLDRVAAAMSAIASDRIVVRTAAADSPKALTVVGVSVDPTAAALGLDDDGETVDLWLELDRPVPAA